MIYTNLKVVWIDFDHYSAGSPSKLVTDFLSITLLEPSACSCICSLCNSLREQTPIDWSNLFQLHETILAVRAKEATGFETTAAVEGSGVHSHRECRWWDEVGYYSFICTWGKVLHKPIPFHHKTHCGRDKPKEWNLRLVLFFKPNQAYFSPSWQQSDLWFSTVTYCCDWSDIL